MNESFFKLHSGLPREAPGEPADVHWAIVTSGATGAVRVLDAGCGPGADLVTLAEALPEARIEGVDLTPHFVAEAQARLTRFSPRVTVREGEMATARGPYDLIWCAGAAYFLGVTELLSKWRTALAPGGSVALSEIVWLKGDPPPALTEFWQAYPAMTDLAGLRDRVAAAGYRILGERVLGEDAWRAYYQPQEVRIAELRNMPQGAEMTEVLGEADAEIALWREFPEYYGYALVVAAPA